MAIENVTLNVEQELYVLDCGSGYTCLGFDVCLERAAKIAEWLTAEGIKFKTPEAERGTLEAYARYTRVLQMADEHCQKTRKRCPAELTPQLVGLEGKRVEVTDKYGETRRFYVGKSTGWMPCHLEIERRNSSGGGGVTGAPFKSLRILKGTR